MLKISFPLIKKNLEIAGLTIFDHSYLYPAFSDDTTFFLKDTISLKDLVETLIFFLYFFRLKTNLSKCEITGTGVLKGVQVTVCGMHFVGLDNDT